MNRFLSLPLLIAAAFANGERASAQDVAATFKAKVKPLIAAHCLDCHGPDIQKAGLRLDTLQPNLADERTLATWVLVHDKLVAGEMPPKKRERPEKSELDAATQWLHKELHAASLERQQKKGRVIVRRLNGTEYENTMRDLLGMNVKLKDRLPDEGTVAGFDNVSAVLDFSATQLLRYQDAAEKAVLSAIPPHPPIPFKDRRTGKEMSEKGPNFRQTLTRSCRLERDGLVIFTKLPRDGLCSSAHVPTAGRYKVRMMIGAVGAENKAVPAAFLTVEQSGREDPVFRELRDIPPGEPAVVELEIDLEEAWASVRGQHALALGHPRFQEADRVV